MRVSTRMIYDSGVSNMQKRTAETLRLQQQLATNKRILVPSDDPVAAAQALEVTQAKTLNDLYTTNQSNANDTMALSEGQLHAANDLLQTMHERIVQLGNSTLSDTDRKSITTEIRQSFEQLKGLANQQDGTGNYLFSGFKGDTQPFTGSIDSGVVYNGDEGVRLLKVSPSRDMQISESGRDIFMANPDKSTPFATGTDSQNTGTGTITAPTLTDASKWNNILNPKNFTIHFAVSAGVTTYDVVDDKGISLLTNTASAITTPPVTPPLPGTYVQGTAIDLKALSTTVGGMDFGASVMIKGSPANGDTFTVKPTGPVSIFDSLSDLVHASEVTMDGTQSGTNRDTFNAQVQSTLANILSAQDNIDKSRSAIGARMSELDSLASASSQRDLDYQGTLSRLQDIDPTKAISDLTRTTTTLQAAQLSFNKITQLSLFNYL